MEFDQSELYTYFSDGLNTFIETFLRPWIAQASISLPEHKRGHEQDIIAAANHVGDFLSEIGFGVELVQMETENSNPIVFAKRIVDPTLQTLIIYGHYDVQPVSTDRWGLADQSLEPFTLREVDGYLYGRGTTDDKGQFATHLLALKYLHDNNCFPHCNFLIVCEGDEESGITACKDFLQSEKYKYYFSKGVVLISDTGTKVAGHPALTVSLKGIFVRDLHFSSFVSLLDFVDDLHDPKLNRVLLPEFYDGIEEPETIPKELEPTKEELLLYLGPGYKAEDGYTEMEHMWYRPTCTPLGIRYTSPVIEGSHMYRITIRIREDTNSLHSGLFGGPAADPGLMGLHMLSSLRKKRSVCITKFSYGEFKNSVEPFATIELATDAPLDREAICTVLQEQGYSKEDCNLFIEVEEAQLDASSFTCNLMLSFRIVAGQDLGKIEDSVAAALPKGARMFGPEKNSLPCKQRTTSREVQAAKKALAKGHSIGKTIQPEEVHFLGAGGSIPIVSQFAIPVLLCGYRLPDDGLHSPNERFSKKQFLLGATSNVLLYDELAKLRN